MRRLSQNAENFYSERRLSVHFRHRGGATTNFLEIPEGQQTFDIIVFAIGSNDLDSDFLTPQQLLNKLLSYASQYLSAGYCRKVIIMGLWPRANRAFNKKSMQFNSLGSYLRAQNIVFWNWSDHLKVKLSRDRVHLVQNSYRRALRYLASPIFYVLKYC